MAALLLMTDTLAPSAQVLPALGLLSHQVRVVPADVTALLRERGVDVILVDGRRELAQARTLCRLIHTTETDIPVVLVLTEGGLAAVNADWQVTDVLLESAGPAEVEARLRLCRGRLEAVGDGPSGAQPGPISSGDLVIDETTYSARLGGELLDLTYKEFELLKHLAQHQGRVFTRAQLLQEVWGYDYFGGTRTIDVHIRRLRAKLGPDYEAHIGTVRNVGYRFVPQDELQTH